MRANSGRRAFTLIELLVVIAIIGILAGLLVPVLNAARGRARVALAKSDVHNITMAITQYTADFDYPPPDAIVLPWEYTYHDTNWGADFHHDYEELKSTIDGGTFANTHPVTPNECLVYFLGTDFRPNVTEGKVLDAANPAHENDPPEYPRFFEGIPGPPPANETRNRLQGFAPNNLISQQVAASDPRKNVARRAVAYGGVGDPVIREARGPYFDFKGDLRPVQCQDGTGKGWSRDGRPFYSFVDPWGLPYFYNARGGAYGEPRHGEAFDLFSVGPNGTTAQNTIDARLVLENHAIPWATASDASYRNSVCAFYYHVLGLAASGNDIDMSKGGNNYTDAYPPGNADDICSWAP